MDLINHLTDEQINSYFVGSISTAEQLQIDQHLSVCPGCNKKLEQLRYIDQLIRNEYRVTPLSVDLSLKLSETLFTKRTALQPIADKILGWAIAFICISGLLYCIWLILSLKIPDFPVILLILTVYSWLSFKEFNMLKNRFYLRHSLTDQ